MQYKGGPRLLITDREGALYLERARVDVEGERVVYHITDDEMQRHFNIPHVNLAVLFLGQGTSISQPAMRLLAEERVHVAVTGSGGAPLHMGSLTTYTGTRHFRALLPIYLDPVLSLHAAKAVMRDRTERMRKLGGAGAQKHLRQRETSGLSKLCVKFDEFWRGRRMFSSCSALRVSFQKLATRSSRVMRIWVKRCRSSAMRGQGARQQIRFRALIV